MNSSFRAHQQGHLNGDNATHPTEPRWRTPAALLLLALRSPQRRRLAGLSQARGLPSSRCPGVRGHTWSRSARLAGRSQARGLPSSRCPGVRGHTWSRSAQPCQRTPSQPTRARPTAVSRMIGTWWFAYASGLRPCPCIGERLYCGVRSQAWLARIRRAVRGSRTRRLHFAPTVHCSDSGGGF